MRESGASFFAASSPSFMRPSSLAYIFSSCSVYSSEPGYGQPLEAVTTMIREDRRRLEKVFGYSEMSAVSEIRDNGLIIKEDYRDDGIYIEADVPARLYGKYS